MDETFIWTEIWKKKTGSSDDFPKRTGCTPWFFRMSTGTKLKLALDYAPTLLKKKIGKSLNLGFFKGLAINVPKWRQSAETWQFPSSLAAMQGFYIKMHH